MTKALSEKAVIETAYKMKHTDIKFMCVRYGNILNSRGSIIEVLQKIGNTSNSHYNLTHPEMTRFIMTQEEAVRLINYTLFYFITIVKHIDIINYLNTSNQRIINYNNESKSIRILF